MRIPVSPISVTHLVADEEQVGRELASYYGVQRVQGR